MDGVLELLLANTTEEVIVTTTRVPGQGINNDPGVDWVYAHLGAINTVKIGIAWIVLLLGLIFNTYFLCCIAFLKPLRKWRYLLIGWQAMCDIFGVCILGFIANFLLFGRWLHPLRDYVLQKIGWLNYVYAFVLPGCPLHEASRLLNEYSVCPVLLFLAYERLVVVVFPFRAKQLLNKWVYVTASVGIPLFTIIGTTAVFRDRNGFCGWAGVGGWYRNPIVKFWSDLFLLFLIPAGICLVIYSFVTAKLLRASRNRSHSEKKEKSDKDRRNLTLSMCFFATTVAWIVLWGFAYFWESQSVLGWKNTSTWNGVGFLIYLSRDLFFNLYSMINPLIFIIVNRQFQEPAKRSWAKFKAQFCGCCRR